eukprot:8003460-Pyramimonas_sp.AAC.1
MPPKQGGKRLAAVSMLTSYGRGSSYIGSRRYRASGADIMFYLLRADCLPIRLSLQIHKAIPLGVVYKGEQTKKLSALLRYTLREQGAATGSGLVTNTDQSACHF